MRTSVGSVALPYVPSACGPSSVTRAASRSGATARSSPLDPTTATSVPARSAVRRLSASSRVSAPTAGTSPCGSPAEASRVPDTSLSEVSAASVMAAGGRKRSSRKKIASTLRRVPRWLVPSEVARRLPSGSDPTRTRYVRGGPGNPTSDPNGGSPAGQASSREKSGAGSRIDQRCWTPASAAYSASLPAETFDAACASTKEEKNNVAVRMNSATSMKRTEIRVIPSVRAIRFIRTVAPVDCAASKSPRR